jgi:hypothetical protein
MDPNEKVPLCSILYFMIISTFWKVHFKTEAQTKKILSLIFVIVIKNYQILCPHYAHYIQFFRFVSSLVLQITCGRIKEPLSSDPSLLLPWPTNLALPCVMAFIHQEHLFRWGCYRWTSAWTGPFDRVG